MNIKKLAGIVASATLAMGLSAPASAINLTAGDYQITFAAFDAGTVNYGNTSGVKCTTTDGCDAVAGLQAAPNAFGGEDTWGIFSVQGISRLSDGSQLFSAGQNGEYLIGMFGGVKDYNVEVGLTPRRTATLGTGGWLNMYLTSQTYDSSMGPSGRSGEFSYTGVTDIGGAPVLSAVFGAGVLGDAPDATYESSFTNTGIQGSGSAYLNVTGGSWGSMFDTNTITDPNGNTRDMFLSTTFSQVGLSEAGWTVNAAGKAEGVLQEGEVPEPASLALFGLGLAGLAALRRRRA